MDIHRLFVWIRQPRQLRQPLRPQRRLLRAVPFVLLMLSLACGLPERIRQSTPTALEPSAIPPERTLAAPTLTPAVPTPTPQPLPPALVEANPQAGAELGLQEPLTLYFNQPMDRASVEAALRLEPALEGSWSWPDESTLIFEPGRPLQPASRFTLEMAASALSAGGQSLISSVSLQFQVVGYLNLTQRLPDPDSVEVDPTAAVVAAFNRPVVPLGAENNDLPAAFSLQPAASGSGKWLNTSTYIFYPQTALEGGKTYTVQLNPDLVGVDGSPLEQAQDWSFTTALPRLVSVQPLPDQLALRLDTVFTVTFNMPMDTASVAANFGLLDDNGALVDGDLSWSAEDTILKFTPSALLRRGAGYTFSLDQQAQGRGGTPLQSGFQASYRAVPALSLLSSDPVPGGQKNAYSGVTLFFSGPLLDRNLLQFIELSPQVSNLNTYFDPASYQLNLYGDFFPSTAYTLSLSPQLSDPWGQRLGQQVVIPFTTAPLPPQIIITHGSNVLYLTGADTSINAQVTNVPSVLLSTNRLDLDSFITMISAENSYELLNSYRAPQQIEWRQAFESGANRTQSVDLYMSPDRRPLAPGLYHLRLTAPSEFYTGPYLLVVSNTQVTFKFGPTDALVWAVNVGDGSPLAGAPVRILDADGVVLAQGVTDDQGLFHSDIPPQQRSYTTYFAMVGEPDQPGFGFALSTWSQGISGWDFGISSEYSPPHLQAYLYTDRPIYRPGHTVYFRGILRQAFNGRYELPDTATLPLILYRDYSMEVARFELPVSAFGTLDGEYTLPADAPPGQYRLASALDEYHIVVYFQVAEYRKPEIDLQVSFADEQVLAGQHLSATINARYFFDAPAGNLLVNWVLIPDPAYFSLPGYQVGAQDTRWLDASSYPGMGESFGTPLLQGEARTDSQGQLLLDLPTEVAETYRHYRLEVTAQDESGQPVSARSVARVHPASFYIGLHPDSWVARADETAGFDVLAVNWDGQPSDVHSLRAEFSKVVWLREDPAVGDPFQMPRFTPQYTLVGSTDFASDGEGLARLAFVPPEPGVYLLRATGEGTVSELYLWVGGPGEVIWPDIPNNRLRLVADQAEYLPGETARIFVPNPFNIPVQALLTVERSTLLRYSIHTIAAGGATLELPLENSDAPNVYASVTMMNLGVDRLPEYRQGYLELAVNPREQILNVSLTSQPQRTGPGQPVTFDLLVTDQSGNPVQGEFSLSVVDRAVLALADPNVPDIVSAFYAAQPLGIRTGVALSAYAGQRAFQPPGMGGGGGAGDMVDLFVRERFPDTAAWFASIQTDASGRAQVSVPLPDSLTTWQVLVRGVTSKTQVGQAEVDVITTKDLIVRPVTPRFLVAGDHVQLAAVVQNNTAADLSVTVSLQADGVVLDDQSLAEQQAQVAAGGRARLEWWGTAQDVPSAGLVFTAQAQSGGVVYQDAARPANGALPVLRYSVPQAFVTAGLLDAFGEQLELVSLPRSFDPTGGELRLDLSPSLAGIVFKSLQVLETYPDDSTERLVSRLLPNLETSLAIQQVGSDDPALADQLAVAIRSGLDSLLARQNQDGGWSWWRGNQSDPHITAYVLLALSRAQQAGLQIGEQVIQQAVNYLYAGLYPPTMASEAWQLDRLSFIHYALTVAGSGDLSWAQALYAVRDQLSPWSQALLSLTFERLSPGSDMADTLNSTLAASAIRSASGAHWEDTQPGWQNMSSPIFTSAVVLYVLAQHDPASPLVADAVRYLTVNRMADGIWHSTYATSWSLMALVELVKSTSELQADYSFQAALNGAVLAAGQASGGAISTTFPLGSLYPDYPNALSIGRSEGNGRLYYSAALRVYRPVESVPAIQQGISLSRVYYPAGVDCSRSACSPLAEISPGDPFQARLTLTLENDAYYLYVQDYIPAGAEILDTSLKTSQQWLDPGVELQPLYDQRSPFGAGWGWWFFNPAQIYDDRIAWSVDYLPAGTYELTYTLVALQAGEFQVLPAQAWQVYFPDVQGNSAGAVFAIR